MLGLHLSKAESLEIWEKGWRQGAARAAIQTQHSQLRAGPGPLGTEGGVPNSHLAA